MDRTSPVPGFDLRWEQVTKLQWFVPSLKGIGQNQARSIAIMGDQRHDGYEQLATALWNERFKITDRDLHIVLEERRVAEGQVHKEVRC